MPYQGFFGNILDGAVQNCQDGQTLGLPIGPDSSHIIAEAVVTAADGVFSARRGTRPVGIRYVDDYFLFFASQGEAEAALADLSWALREFELQVNFDKTHIRPVWIPEDDTWTHEIRAAQISTEASAQKSHINRFFEFLKRTSARYSDENVAVYGLKRIASVLIRPSNWSIFEAHVCHLAMAHPNALDFVSRIFTTYRRYEYRLNLERIGRMCHQLIQDHAPLGHHSEVAWALWICRDLSIDVAPEAADAVTQMQSSVCALLLLDLQRLGRLSAAIHLSHWIPVRRSAALWEELWLLSYEAGVRGWGGFTEAHVRADRHFNELRIRGVRFYDEDRNQLPLFTVPEDMLDANAPGQDGTLAFFERSDAEEYIEFEDDDGGYGEPVEDEEEDEAPNNPF